MSLHKFSTPYLLQIASRLSSKAAVARAKSKIKYLAASALLWDHMCSSGVETGESIQ